VALVKPPMQVGRANHVTLACPPLGLAYLASTLRSQGIHVTVVDALGEAPDDVRPLEHNPNLLRYGLEDEQILARIPRDTTIVGVSCMFSEEWPVARTTIRAIGRALPEAFIVCGGEHVSATAGLVLRECPEVNACALGEGEETLLELARALDSGRPLSDVPGLVLRSDTRLLHTSRRARIRALDAIPPPAWDLLPMEQYLVRGLGYGVRRGRSMPIVATRGCPFQCTFCSSPQMWTTRWNARDPEAVLNEMADSIERWRVQNFDFYDLTAIVRKDWIVEFSRRLAEKRWNITWQIPAGTRSEALDGEVLQLLFASGCRNIAYAPESGSPAVLRRIKKRVKLERMKASMRQAVAAGLKVKCNLVMGFPDETHEEMAQTIELCRELATLGIHDVNVTPFCPYPGSELFEQLLASGRISGLDDRYFEMLASYSDLMQTASFNAYLSSRQLGRLRWSAMFQFYAMSFALHPLRAASLASNLALGRETTRLERALTDIAQRQLAVWRGRAGRRRVGHA